MQQNDIFTDKHLASLAAIMLLAPAVAYMMNEKDISITADEEIYVRSYIRYGYYILMTLGLAMLVRASYSFFFPYAVLYRINYTLLGSVILMIVIGVFSIINNKTLIDRNIQANDAESNPAVIIYYVPLYNYYLWYNEQLNENNSRRVKESVILRSLYLILISAFPHIIAIVLGLFVIIARCIMLTAGMDILSAKGKDTLNKLLTRNIEELVAYPLAVIFHPLKKLFKKGTTLAEEIHSWKLTYETLDPLSHPRTIISYLIALAAIGYRGYITWTASGPTIGISVALVPQIFRLMKIIMTALCGKLPRVPVLYTLLGGRKGKQTPPVNTPEPAQPAPTVNTPATAAPVAPATIPTIP